MWQESPAIKQTAKKVSGCDEPKANDERQATRERA